MGVHESKMIRIGVVLYMVLGSIANTFDMPCWASASSAAAEAEERDPEDVSSPSIGHAAQLRIEFIKGFNSRLALEGDSVVGKLMEDMKLLDGCTLAPKGSRIYGRVELVNRSKSLTERGKNRAENRKRHASVVLRFDKVVTPQKTKFEITGSAAPQYNIFSNGETVRMVMVGGDGELLRTEDTELSGLPELGLIVPHDWVKLRGRYQIDVRPGDELLVDIDLGRHNDVQAELVGSKGSKTH
jgi:hypothetical protein